jgi:hypothetical protein
LNEELAYQYEEFEDEDYALTTYLERFTPFNQNEYPALNVRFVRSELKSQDATGSIYNNTFWVEFYASNPSSDEEGGDTINALQITKVLSSCRHILKSSPYVKLGFTSPLIGNVSPRTLETSELRDNMDAMICMYGRFVIEVEACEDVELVTPSMIEEHEAIVKLYESNKGYTWVTLN